MVNYAFSNSIRFLLRKKVVTRPFESTNRIRLFKIARYSVSNYQQRILMKSKKAQRNNNKFVWISFTFRLLILACKILTVLCFWSSLYFDWEKKRYNTLYTHMFTCVPFPYVFIHFRYATLFGKTKIINSFLLRRTIPFVRSLAHSFARPSIRLLSVVP